MATNALAMGVVINSIFGVGLGWGIWIGMGVTLAYSASGGILAGIYNDVFQGTLMAIASVLVFLFVLGFGGGLGEISRTILGHDPAFLGPWGKLTPLAALSFFFVFSMGSLGQPQAVHKYYMLRDPLQLKWYPLLKTLGLVLVLLLYFGAGIGVKAFVLSGRLPPLASPDQATPSLLLNVTPIILAALVFSGIAAATMSAANSFINIGAAIVTHDLPVAFGRRVKDELLWGRATTILIAVAAAITAQRSGTMVAFLGIFGWGLFLDARSGTCSRTQLARRNARGSNCVDPYRPRDHARAGDSGLSEGVQISRRRNRIGCSDGIVVPGFLRCFVADKTIGAVGDRSRRSTRDGALIDR
jgi:Na+/proline symporter